MLKNISDLRRLYEPNGNLVPDKPVVINCPFHREDTSSFAVYATHAYCFGCRKWEGFYNHLRRLGLRAENIINIDAIQSNRKRPEVLPLPNVNELVEQYHKNLFLLKKEQWFYERGLTLPTIVQARLGHAGKCFVIPIYSTGRSLTGDVDCITLRFRRDEAHTHSGPKYWGIRGYNQVYLYTPFGIGERIIWTEGEFDSLIACQCGHKGVSLTNGIGGDPSPFIPFLEKVKEIIIAVDNDSSSYRRSLQLSSTFRGAGKSVKLVRMKYKDLNELFLAEGEEGIKKVLGEVE